MESAITINPSGLNLVYSRYTTGRHGITYTCRSAMICRDDRELFFLHFSVFHMKKFSGEMAIFSLSANV